MIKYEPLDQTNPVNRCKVDGVEYVAHTSYDQDTKCLRCIGSRSGTLCEELSGCERFFADRSDSIYWRPASEPTSPVATMGRKKVPQKLVGRTVRMLQSEHDEIDRIAKRIGETPADLRRDALRNVIENNKTARAGQ